jgi:hypothetical protein
MLLRLDMPTVSEVLSRDDLSQPKATPHRRGLAVKNTPFAVVSEERTIDQMAGVVLRR